ncbi:MAG: hypothetical protein JJE15_11370, partial [Desulfobacteraceae bacterium]|nr:hypothetical protein [Desulfobacteraceae bacterium]
MSRLDCISNRNIKIIASYVYGKLGTYHPLFEALPYPADEHPSPEDFFLDEDEWTTYDNFEQIFRRAKELVGEPDFFFNCGASSARLRSWGRFHYFAKVFATPDDGFEKLPFFNKNLDDTKEIELILPPAYDRRSRKTRTILKVQFHSDFDPNKDYIGDPYLRGIISSIPTIWGMAPASIKQPLNPYNPEVLFNEDPEFAPYELAVKMEGDFLTLQDPDNGQRRTVGEKVLLEPEIVNGQKVFLGKHGKCAPDLTPHTPDKMEAILITETVQIDNRVLLSAGEIFMAPYFILHVSYDRTSLWQRISHIFEIRGDRQGSVAEMMETINQLRKSIRAKNEANLALEKTNEELKRAKAQLDEYARELEQKVEERTAELRKAQQDLLKLNRDLESKVKDQVDQLERYNELRRYLSPKL